jgi:hypothetical protein
MTILHLKSKTDADGQLHLPVGVPDSEVEVTVRFSDNAGKSAQQRRDEYHSFLKRMAGSITDTTFVRPEQPPIKPVEPL